jgi:hypothetical protein
LLEGCLYNWLKSADLEDGLAPGLTQKDTLELQGAKKNPIIRRDWSDAHLINSALDIHRDDPAFGYRFISDELGRY